MRLPFQRPSALRVAIALLVFATCLVLIWANYSPPLYGDGAEIAVWSAGDRTAEGMAGHERRLGSAENLRRAALDPRLAGLDRPLRAGEMTEIIGSVPGPAVYVFVRSVDEGVLGIDSVSENSAEEARSIALAVADAYIAELGEDHVALAPSTFPTATMFLPSSLSESRRILAALFLGGLASGFVLFAPSVWFSRRRLAMTLVLAPAVALYLFEQITPPMFPGFLGPFDLVAAPVLLATLGLGAMRRPWVFLALAILLWITAPVIFHAFNTPSLVGQFSWMAWVVGATAGYLSRPSAPARGIENEAEAEPWGKA